MLDNVDLLTQRRRGGFFAGKLTKSNDSGPQGGRFDPNTGSMGALYRARYLNDGYFEALELIKKVAVCHIQYTDNFPKLNSNG
jgi:hypothetical protein